MKPLSLKHPNPSCGKQKGRRIGTQNQLLDSVGEDCRAPNGNALIWRGVTSGLSGRSPRINADNETEVLPVCLSPRTVFCICFTKC